MESKTKAPDHDAKPMGGEVCMICPPENKYLYNVDEPKPGGLIAFDVNGSYSFSRPEFSAHEKSEAEVKFEALSNEGRQLVHQIYVRKGNQLLMNKAGTRMKPMAQTIFAKNMAKLRAGVSPVDIVSDLQAQLKLI